MDATTVVTLDELEHLLDSFEPAYIQESLPVQNQDPGSARRPEELVGIIRIVRISRDEAKAKTVEHSKLSRTMTHFHIQPLPPQVSLLSHRRPGQGRYGRYSPQNIERGRLGAVYDSAVFFFFLGGGKVLFTKPTHTNGERINPRLGAGYIYTASRVKNGGLNYTMGWEEKRCYKQGGVW